MNNKIFVKTYEKTAIDYYETSLEREENGLIGEYEEMDKGDGIEHLCNTFEGELAYIGYAKTSEELESLVEKWGEESGEGSDWAMNEFSGENYYCMVYCEGQDKGGAFRYDYALSLFYDELVGEVMLSYLLDKYSQNFDYWSAWDLREFIIDSMDIKVDSNDEQVLDDAFTKALGISLDDYEGDAEEAFGSFEAVDAWEGVKHMIKFNHIDFERVDF